MTVDIWQLGAGLWFGRMAVVAAVFFFRWKKNDDGKQKWNQGPVAWQLRSSVMIVVLETYDVLQQQHDRQSRWRTSHDEVVVAL